MVLCSIWVIHVVPMMYYLLEYCGLLLLSLVGLAVCGCIQNIQRYLCKLIVGDYFLIDVLYSYLWLISVVICTTIGGGIFHLRCIVPLRSGSWMYGLLSLNCCPCDYLGETTSNWYPWLPFPFLMLLMLFFVKCNPGLIPWIFNYVVNSVKARILSLSLIFFVTFFIMALQSYTYIMYMYLFPLFGFIGKRPHKLE